MAEPHVFSTRDIPIPDQQEAWRSWHGAIAEVSFPEQGSAEAGFAAESRIWLFDGMALARVRAPALRVVRSALHTRRDPADHWIVTIGMAATHLQLACETFTVQAGVPFLASLAEPCVSERVRDERLHLYLSRDRFASLASVLDGLRGPAPGAFSALFVRYLLLIEEALPTLPDADAARLPGAIASMLTSAIELAPRDDTMPRLSDHSVMARVRSAVRRRIASVSLGPKSLCRDVGISRSRLYRLLEGKGGVMRYIQQQRLRACYADLANPADTRPIAVIAERHGFSDPSSFSRAFRREFSLTPSDVRNGLDKAAFERESRGCLPASLHEHLRGL